MINQAILSRISELLDSNRFLISTHAQMDILKQGYRWSAGFIKECLQKGKKYNGRELYPENEQRHARYYCIHEYLYLLGKKLILICFLIEENLLVIHIQPLNLGSKEGKRYYS